jgi:tetratricopeptide (TPR) repeat protein
LALASFRKATELDASNAMSHLLQGHLLSQMGEHVEALALVRRARELDPLFPLMYSIPSQAAFQARDFADARDFAKQAIAMQPQFWVAHMHLGQVLEQLDDSEAITALDNSIRYSGGNSKPVALRGYVLARVGRVDEAKNVLAQLESSASTQYVPPYAFALMYAGLDDENAARVWLERSAVGRDVHLVFVTVDPKWDRWRERAWFKSVLDTCDFMKDGQVSNQRRRARI